MDNIRAAVPLEKSCHGATSKIVWCARQAQNTAPYSSSGRRQNDNACNGIPRKNAVAPFVQSHTHVATHRVVLARCADHAMRNYA